jgi:hypothetical protein
VQRRSDVSTGMSVDEDGYCQLYFSGFLVYLTRDCVYEPISKHAPVIGSISAGVWGSLHAAAVTAAVGQTHTDSRAVCGGCVVGRGVGLAVSALVCMQSFAASRTGVRSSKSLTYQHCAAAAVCFFGQECMRLVVLYCSVAHWIVRSCAGSVDYFCVT